MQRLVEGHAVGGASGACKRNHTERQSFFTQRIFMQSTTVNLNRSEVVNVILSALRDVLESQGVAELPALDETTRLIGRSAALDSMGLVTLIVEVEQRLEEAFDLVVVLADDRAMSQTRSPFLSVATLADYVMQLAAEQG
jgi:acyl carrier protein